MPWHESVQEQVSHLMPKKCSKALSNPARKLQCSWVRALCKRSSLSESSRFAFASAFNARQGSRISEPRHVDTWPLALRLGSWLLPRAPSMPRYASIYVADRCVELAATTAGNLHLDAARCAKQIEATSLLQQPIAFSTRWHVIPETPQLS